MSAIGDKVLDRAERLIEEQPEQVVHAIAALVAKAEAWKAAGMPFSALGDEILLTVGVPLGLRLKIGEFAQLIDLDEEGN